MSGMYRDLLEDRDPSRMPSPYNVHSLLMIMTATCQGQARTDRRVTDAEDRLMASLWKLGNRQAHDIDSDISPESKENEDVNRTLPLAASVAYDAAALRAVLESAFLDKEKEIDEAHTKVLVGLLRGCKDIEAGDLLSFNSTYTMARVRESRGSLKR